MKKLIYKILLRYYTLKVNLLLTKDHMDSADILIYEHLRTKTPFPWVPYIIRMEQAARNVEPLKIRDINKLLKARVNQYYYFIKLNKPRH